MTILRHIDEQALALAGFEDEYYSHTRYVGKSRRLAGFYCGLIPGTQTNIIVGEHIRINGGKIRTDFYFNVYKGKHSDQSEFKTDKEVYLYLDAITETVARKNRIAGRDLQARILEVVEKASLELTPAS